MKANLKFLICILLSGLLSNALILTAEEEQGRQWHHNGPSEWVDFYDISGLAAKTEGTDQSSLSYLLYDRQVNAAADEYYVRIAYRINNDNGIQSGSQISINFNPSFQTLTLHDINLIRGGEKLDRLDLDQIKTLQREQNLDYYIYDESLTVLTFLEDVRKGDIIEFSYTYSGSNPVFDGRFFISELMQWSIPIIYSRLRLLYPNNRYLNIESHGHSFEPLIKNGQDYNEYIWEIRDSLAIVFEDNVPVWYDPYPFLQITEFESWSQFQEWIVPFYETPNDVSNSLGEKIAEFERMSVTPEQRILEVIRFLQDEIRYLGIELGAGSYIPSNPSDVYDRRYGDCKDKTLLLCTILSQLDIEAYPVLVNSTRMHTIGPYAPSPLNFNHVIAKIKYQGNTLWVDPTITSQGGSFGNIDLPPYGIGLVLDDDGTPEPMKIGDETNPGILEIIEIYNARDFAGETGLRAQFTYKNGEADYKRLYFAQMSKTDIDDDYLNYFASLYPEIAQDGSSEIVDDSEENSIELISNYRIKNFWQTNEETDTHEAQFTPIIFYDILTKPEVILRKMPYVFYHPLFLRHITEIRLPDDIQMDDFENTIQNDFFVFKTVHNFNQNLRIIRLEYSIETRTDFIPADRTAEYIRAVENVYNNIGFYVSYAADDTANSDRDEADTDQDDNFLFPDTASSTGALTSMISMLSLFFTLLIRMISTY